MPHRPLKEIAAEIRADWKPRINGAAEPYVAAMSEISCCREQYGLETGFDMVRGFLMNAQTWRGEVAREIKTELRVMLKDAQ